MSLYSMGTASNEKKLQRIFKLKKAQKEGQCYTVEAAAELFGLSERTIISYAKEGNIPLYYKSKPLFDVESE